MQKEARALATFRNATLTQANLLCMHCSVILQRAAWEVSILNIFHAGAALEKNSF